MGVNPDNAYNMMMIKMTIMMMMMMIMIVMMMMIIAVTQPIFRTGPQNFAWKNIQITLTI